MSPPISKDAILDAAEAIVRESGAAHMTLDGVAERAQVSKGGLMYSFPTKAALLQGMIRRLMDSVDGLREEARREFGDAKPTELMVEIRVLAKLDEVGNGSGAALLATIANQPSLMEPFRDEMRRRLEGMAPAGRNTDRFRIIYLAALGLHFSALLAIPFLDAEQREQTYDELVRLASDTRENL